MQVNHLISIHLMTSQTIITTTKCVYFSYCTCMCGVKQLDYNYNKLTSTVIVVLLGAHYTCEFLLCVIWWTGNSIVALQFNMEEQSSICVSSVAR